MQSQLAQQNNIQPPKVMQTNQYASQPTIQPVMQQVPVQSQQPQQAQNVQVPNYSGVNIQIFNPTVTPTGATAPVYNVNAPNYGGTPVNGCYPPNYYTNDFGKNNQNNTNTTTTTNTENKKTEKKTEKREIVQLTDDYIRNLENYLNSQNKDVRLMGAKEVVARLEEDHSRKNDKALNALINKMLQDPYSPVKILALSALDSGVVSGDDFTINVLKQMQNSDSGYGQDAMQATNILLKMSGPKVEKEFEVKDNKQSTQKTEKK